MKKYNKYYNKNRYNKKLNFNILDKFQKYNNFFLFK